MITPTTREPHPRETLWNNIPWPYSAKLPSIFYTRFNSVMHQSCFPHPVIHNELCKRVASIVRAFMVLKFTCSFTPQTILYGLGCTVYHREMPRGPYLNADVTTSHDNSLWSTKSCPYDLSPMAGTSPSGSSPPIFKQPCSERVSFVHGHLFNAPSESRTLQQGPSAIKFEIGVPSTASWMHFQVSDLVLNCALQDCCFRPNCTTNSSTSMGQSNDSTAMLWRLYG